MSKIEAAENAKMGILKAVDAIGGFGSTINEGDKVLVKPNFNSAGILPVSTEPEWVSKVFSVSLCPVFFVATASFLGGLFWGWLFLRER